MNEVKILLESYIEKLNAVQEEMNKCFGKMKYSKLEVKKYCYKKFIDELTNIIEQHEKLLATGHCN